MLSKTKNSKDSKERGTVISYHNRAQMPQTQDNMTTLNWGQFNIILSSQTSFCISVDSITNAF